MNRKVKIGLIQTTAKLGDVEHNIENAAVLIKKAAEDGANIVCLPELFATGYNLGTLAGKTTELIIEHFDYIKESMSRAAKDNRVYVIAPSGEVRDVPGVVHNSALVFSDDGSFMGSFAKSHLWALERFYFREGDDYPVFDTKYGRIGIAICYDIGFPETCRILMLKGAEIIFAPSAWCVQDMDMWDLNLPQRALENVLFTVGINIATNEHGLHLFGKSKICNPRGTVLKELPVDKQTHAVVEIDLEDISKFRQQIHYLKDRKPHIYGKLTES